MKNFKKVLALVLVVATLLSFATVASAKVPTDAFTDKKDIKADYSTAVDVLTYLGVLAGYPNKTFRPQGEITRAEAAKIIAMLDNGSSEINGLYASANPFTDSKGHWAESFIAYCYKTGVIDGIGNLKFAPDAKVTGVQFLKMTLIVLGYDAKKEGLTGASWAVNTLALAKKAGLLAGLGYKYDYSANLTREAAAQIMLNALKANTVEYGYEAKELVTINDDLKTFTYGYVTVAGAVTTANHLYDTWKLGNKSWDDCFMRPGDYWYLQTNKENVIAKYKDTPVTKHQTAITGCDILVDAGIPKTDLSNKIYLEVYANGVEKKDGYDTTGDTAGLYITLKHSVAHNSENNLCDAAEFVFGGQGTQAELYFMGYETDGTPAYRLVLIETWLAKVTAVAKTTIDKDGHVVAGNAITVKAWDNEVSYTTTETNEPSLEWTASATGFAKGDMVLVTHSWKQGCGVVDVNAAVAKDGVLTGFIDVNKFGKPTSTEVDTVETPDAVKFKLGYPDSKTIANTQQNYPYVSGEYTFYYDLFGNVIGMTGRKAAAAKYVVINEIWSHAHREYTVTADLVNLDATFAKDSVAASVTAHGVDYTSSLSALSAENGNFYDRLYTYTQNAAGKYILTRANVEKLEEEHNAIIVKGDPNVYKLADNAETEAKEPFARLNEDTQFLFRTGKDTYVNYVGFENVPTLSADYLEWIDDNDDGYADVVYGYGMKLDGTSDICFTFDTTKHYTKTIKGTRYEVWSVYIDGKLTTVYTELDEDGNTEDFDETGLYYLSYETVDGVVVAKVTALGDVAYKTYTVEEKDVASCDKNSLVFVDESTSDKLAAKAINVTGIPVYKFDTLHDEVEAAETADLDGAKDVLVLKKGTTIIAFYIPYEG